MTDPVAVTGYDDLALVLGTRAFEPVAYEARISGLADRLGFDASEVLRAVRAVPLCQRGKAHTETRKRLAALIGQATERVSAFAETDVVALSKGLLSPGPHDVMQELVLPVVDGTIAQIIGVAPESKPDAMISRLFSQSIGVAKRKRMNAEFAGLRTRLSDAFPELDDRAIDDRIALSVLGTDALRGTIGCSLHALFAQDGDGEATQMPPKTGVPYVEREAVAEVTVSGQSYPAQTHFRACLDALEQGSDKDKMRFWGYGAHTCLGRQMSVQVWQAIAASFKGALHRIAVTDYALRRDDVFAIPEMFMIEVTDG